MITEGMVVPQGALRRRYHPETCPTLLQQLARLTRGDAPAARGGGPPTRDGRGQTGLWRNAAHSRGQTGCRCVAGHGPGTTARSGQ